MKARNLIIDVYCVHSLVSVVLDVGVVCDNCGKWEALSWEAYDDTKTGGEA